MTQSLTRLGCLVLLLSATTTTVLAGPGFDDDQDIVVLRDVPSRPAYRPDIPKSPNSTGVETSPEEAVNAGLSTIVGMSDADLSQGRASAPVNIINQALSPLTGGVDRTSRTNLGANAMNGPVMGSALISGTSRIAPAITGAINGAVLSGLGLNK